MRIKMKAAFGAVIYRLRTDHFGGPNSVERWKQQDTDQPEPTILYKHEVTVTSMGHEVVPATDLLLLRPGPVCAVELL